MELMPSGKKRILVSIANKSYKAHRIIWMLLYGYFPDEIDHIDGNSTNNRLYNLRDVDHLENHKNIRLQSNGPLGIPGVRFIHGKYQARIKVKQKEYGLGLFCDFFEACCARKASENKFGFHWNHGTIRPL